MEEVKLTKEQEILFEVYNKGVQNEDCDLDAYVEKMKQALSIPVVSDTLILTPKDAEVFFNEIMNPKDANEALKKAMLKFITR